MGNNRHGIPAVSALSKHIRRFTSGCIRATSRCCWCLFVHNLLLFLVLLLSNVPLLIYWYTWYFLPKHACNSSMHEFHRIEFGLFLEISSITEFWSFLWNIHNSCPFCSIIHWKRLRWVSGENTHSSFWMTISFWPKSIFKKSLSELFFQAEKCLFMGISSRPYFLSLWDYHTAFLTLWVALYKANLNDLLKGGIHV